MDKVKQFVDSLARAQPQGGLINIYQYPAKRENLTRWLQRPDHGPPSVLLLGEAPGSHGAALTGVPFVSPEVLMRGPKGGDPWRAFGMRAGYRGMNVSPEPAATMVWEVVARQMGNCPLPMTWNEVPFWLRGNKAPRVAERKHGREWVLRLIDIYPDALVVAVGKNAEEACRDLGLHHEAIRHPMHSGKEQFEEGIGRIAASLCP